MRTELQARLAEIPLIDHHVHGPLKDHVSRAEFELLITESDRPVPAWMTQFDSQVGFAVRRHCAPVLGLPPHASPEEYWATRSGLEPGELTRRLLAASRTRRWLVETGYAGERIAGLSEFGELVEGRVDEVVRLESVLESVARGCTADGLVAAFRDELQRRARDAVGLKSIVAYRHGFDFDPEPPSRGDVLRAAERWLRTVDAGAEPRVDDIVLLRMLLREGVSTGLPLQLHAGYGDPDVELHRCDPLLLTRWLKAIEGSGTDVLLLHCYPFHRNAGYLAQAFPHVYFDVGLAINYTGARSAAVVAESLELAPFAKLLYSSDAWGPPELHHLGAVLWRRGMALAMAEWVDEGEWSLEEAVRVATLIGRENAARVYGLDDD
ncbi:amidohydrolase family protein [Saccharopolyspora mangrovi]|uniref:Amidohydrolase family protein n=1 Tax=Saccharopolyspora mangrovi TaxID=3082379 RepID=A0ABU6ABT7_9PSEU|nr:amidohydrolase family protein [Saccharopolyspora sp. S2-29]MEB3368953.1 amidohydrolase family protein [Saccharopolyspora sp. S2-29]